MNLVRLIAEHRQNCADDLAMSGVLKYDPRFCWTRPEITFVRRLRQAEFARRLVAESKLFMFVYLVSRFRYQLLCARYGATVPLDVFGPGFSLAHVGTVTINSDSIVGKNCRLHPGVTIGAIGDRSPTIGDDVFIGPNAVIVGGVTVGDRVHIGPCAVVSRNVEEDQIVTVQPSRLRERTRTTWQEGQKTKARQQKARQEAHRRTIGLWFLAQQPRNQREEGS